MEEILLGCVIAIVAILFAKVLISFTPEPSYIVSATYENQVMTVTYSNGKVKKYKGECTVWHELPSFKRCDTPKESLLADLWEYIRHHKHSYGIEKIN